MSLLRFSRPLFCIICFILASLSIAQTHQQNAIPPTQLKVGEGFINPVGHYEAKPRFSWQLAQAGEQQFQTAYHIQVSSDKNFSNSAIIWDSKKVISNETAWIRYEGKALSSQQTIFWRVRTWGRKTDASPWSQTQFVELGLLHNHDWQAKWIGHQTDIEGDKNSKRFSNIENSHNEPQYLRKTFKLDAPIKKARLYITAKGIFKPYINGQAISDDVMTPGWTPYHKRIETLTYDVTSFLKQGDNAIGAALAKGWYSGRIFGPTPQAYTLPIQLIAQLDVTYTDGRQYRIKTDGTWQATNQGPIRAASNYDGEKYDANFDITGWNTANYNATNDTWSAVYTQHIDPNIALSPKRHAPSHTALTLSPQNIVSIDKGIVVYDMGQNMVGVPEINLPGKKGQTIKLRFSEALEGDTFYVKNLRSAKNIDLYTPSQNGVVSYRPTFTFHGYRYVEISGYDNDYQPKLDWLKGHVLHSNFAVYDNFTSNHTKLNKLSNNVSWGLRGNFLDIPTDCPQRDERLGWTGDAQVFVSTSMYKADVYAFWAAWLESMREEQSIDGMIPKFVPFRAFLTDGTAAAWGDAATIVPWKLYQFTGDKHILAENYTMMKRWMQFSELHSVNYISNMGTYGDWLQPFSKNGRAKGDTHPDLIATAYYARSAEITAKTARVLGYVHDAAQFERLHANIKNTFRAHFFDEQVNVVTSTTKTIKRDRGKRLKKPQKSTINVVATQTSYLLPLAFNLFNEQEQQKAVQHLLSLIDDSDNHLRTGFLGTPMLHQVLEQYGHSDVMYDILLQETYPSWFYSINNGATTTWERWNSYSLTDGYNKANMNSLNHYAYGAVAQWFYTGMLGIKSLEAGFKRVEINPQFTRRLNQLKGRVPTPNGDIKVAWKINKNQLSMQITVPQNTTAQLNLPSVSGINIARHTKAQQAQSSDTNTPLKPGKYTITGTIAL